MNKSLRHVLAAASLVALTAPLTAHATLAELSWSGRFGSGFIVYDRDAADALAADGQGSFLDSIVNFRVGGIRLPYGGDSIVLTGHSGSILSRDIVTPCNYFQNCESSSLTFLLGRSHANDPLSYRLTLNLPFALDSLDQLPLNAEGSLPPLSEGDQIGAAIRNELNSPSGNYLTLGFGALVTHRLLAVASPVPEPTTWALFGLGAGLLGVASRRKALRQGPLGRVGASEV